MNHLNRTIPAGIKPQELEIYWDDEEKDLFAMSSGHKYRFTDLPEECLDALHIYMQKDTEAMQIIQRRGPQPRIDRLWLYYKCFFGGYNCQPDKYREQFTKEVWNCPCRHHCILHTLAQTRLKTKNGTITPRELNVIRTLFKNPALIGDAIAEKLNISPFTLNRHKQNIFRKTGLQSIHQLAIWATKMNII